MKKDFVDNQFTYFSRGINWRSKWTSRVFSLIYLVLFFWFLFAYRYTILNGLGHFLVANDQPQTAEALFVLGGNSLERGTAAVTYHQQFPEAALYTTGGHYPSQVEAFGYHITEAELTKKCMMNNGIDSTLITPLGSAHSTFDESNEILALCKDHGYKKIALLSSLYHLRRLRLTFEERFAKEGIQVVFIGADTENVRPDQWYRNEEGLITYFGEYIKVVYYLFKYS